MTGLVTSGRVRLVVFGLVALAFLVGGLAGAAIDRVAAGEVTKRAAQVDEERAYVIDEITMSADQRETIDAILERRSERMKVVWDEYSPRLRAITDSARAEIMQVLTTEQRAEYERRLDEHRAKREARREND